MTENNIDFNNVDYRPLAAKMRPENMAQYIGQEHILAKGKPLRKAIISGQLHSMILWGPPGTGKTTLAQIIGYYAQAKLEQISAVTSGIKEIRAAVDKAKSNRILGYKTILFVDEVHRFNKSQQDAFLPFIENGVVTFIGATTENPSFALNNALLSRARVYKLKSLTSQNIVQIIKLALQDKDKGLGNHTIKFKDELMEQLASFVNGDARMALNLTELMADMSDENEQGNKEFTLDLLAEVTGEKVARFDNKGDGWYDLISALHKSIRGSNPDAALYWYARMMNAGCDPLYVARRLLAIASEDVGNADPRGMQIAVAAWDCYTKVGPAEGERAIAQAIVFLATAAKSNAVYVAWNAAKQDAKEFANLEVPLHLKNAPTKLMKKLGYGAEYRYAHDEPNAYAAGENYFPFELRDRVYYKPVKRGLEIKIGEKLDFLNQLDIENKNPRYS